VFASALARYRAETAARESEDRFRLLADTAPLMIWLSGADGRRTYFNRRWLELTGRRSDEDLGEGWADSVHTDDRALAVESYRSAVSARQPFTLDYRLRRWDGDDRWVLDHGVPRIDENGAFTGYVGSVIDITALNTALRAVLESTALRSAIFGSLYVRFAAIDRDGVIIAVNHSWTRFAEELGPDPRAARRSASTTWTPAVRPPRRRRRRAAGARGHHRRPHGEAAGRSARVRVSISIRRALVRDDGRALPAP